MIQAFVDRFIAAQPELEKRYLANQPGSYDQIVKDVIEIVHDEEDYGGPDPERIHVIDDGDYQGTRLFVIAAEGYQPSTYWSVFVSYGSCSGCDTYESLSSDWGYEDEEDPTDRRQEAAKGFVLLALHIVQSFSLIGGSS